MEQNEISQKQNKVFATNYITNKPKNPISSSGQVSINKTHLTQGNILFLNFYFTVKDH